MPFVFQVQSRRDDDGATQLHGRITVGAFFGPERACARDASGRQTETRVLGHGVVSPEGWPVRPEHAQTRLRLTVEPLPPDFEVVEVQGLGAVNAPVRLRDITPYATEPAFWACVLAQHGTTEHEEDPALDWLGVDTDQASEWHAAHIDPGLAAHEGLELRQPVGAAGRTLALRMTAGTAFQDQLRLGHADASLLLGYHGGHFSLPALRVAEAAAVAAATQDSVLNLLWLTFVHARPDEVPVLHALVTRAAAALPGLRVPQQRVADALVERQTSPTPRWWEDPVLGWINDGRYSQRNPASDLSNLRPADHAFIRDWFGALPPPP